MDLALLWRTPGLETNKKPNKEVRFKKRGALQSATEKGTCNSDREM